MELYRGIGTRNYSLMKNYLKKKDSISFQKFVNVRGEIILAIMDSAVVYAPKNVHHEIFLALEKMFTKKNFVNMVWVDIFISCKNTQKLFESLLNK